MKEFFCESDFKNAINQDLASDYKGKYISLENVLMIANRLLRERGTVVYTDEKEPVAWTDRQLPEDIKRALLVCVEPIERDSAEKIVEELAKLQTELWYGPMLELADRAKKLRGGK